MSNTINSFLKFYFNPNILSEEEAREELEEIGVDTKEMESSFQNYLKKVQARKKLLEADIKKEKFEKNLAEFNNLQAGNNNEEMDPNIFRLAARKGNENIDDGNDAALLEYLRKKSE
ncbi:MAG: hypothetical protein AB1521_08280 [Bacteroidota bacterium]